MRRLITTLGLTVLLAGPAGVTLAEPAPDASSIPQETRVAGTPPALEGRWLLLVTHPGGAARSGASGWEVRHVDGRLRLEERVVELPEGGRSPRAAETWEPSAGDLAAIAGAWDHSALVPPGIARLEHEIVGPDAFDDTIRSESVATGALWLVRQTRAFAPGVARPAREIRVFAPNQTDGRGYRGKYLIATIALVPIPVPIKVEGTFRLIRLEPPARPFWRRALDALRGCN